MNLLKGIAGAVLACVCVNAHAELNLEITGGIDSGRKITIVPFGGQNLSSVNLSDIVRNDLSRTGIFAPSTNKNFRSLPHRAEEVRAADFEVGTEAVVVGEISAGSGGKFVVNYTVSELVGSEARKKFGFRAEVPASKMREYAHIISDAIFEKLTGIKGAFNTKIAYIRTLFGSKYPYELCISDYDGANEVRLLVSTQPLMSPNWSPDGRHVAYVSFQNRKAEIYSIDVSTKNITRITSLPGLNSNPKWSPDGQRMAMVLSKDGNPEIYVLNLATKGLSRITNNPAIDTEPAWTASGDGLYFVSERGGRAQIYKYSMNSGSVSKVTGHGSKNLSPAAMPDGSGLVMISQNGGFSVGRQDNNGGFYSLSNTGLDESPSVAPNGTMIIYSTVSGGRKGLTIVSSDGRSKTQLDKGRGEMSQPSWSYFLRK